MFGEHGADQVLVDRQVAAGMSLLARSGKNRPRQPAGSKNQDRPEDGNHHANTLGAEVFCQELPG
jgi:hypothetical protein